MTVVAEPRRFRGRRGRNRRYRETIEALTEQLDNLREENLRLAREHALPASGARTASKLRDLSASLDQTPQLADRDDSGADAAFAGALEVEMMRRTLVEVCELLQTMAAQLSESLTNRVPLHELDRRVRNEPVAVERRRSVHPLTESAEHVTVCLAAGFAPTSEAIDRPIPLESETMGNGSTSDRQSGNGHGLTVVDAESAVTSEAAVDGAFG